MQLASIIICVLMPLFCLWTLQQTHGWTAQNTLFKIAVASLAVAFTQKAFERISGVDAATLIDVWRDMSMLGIAMGKVWLGLRGGPSAAEISQTKVTRACARVR